MHATQTTVTKPPAVTIEHSCVRCMHQVNVYSAHDADAGSYLLVLVRMSTDWHMRRKGSVAGVHHGKCGARAYNGGLGAEPPPGHEAESILVIGCPTEPANLAPLVKFSK